MKCATVHATEPSPSAVSILRYIPYLGRKWVCSGVRLAGLGQFYRCGARVCPTPMDPPEHLSRWGQQVHCLRAIHYRKAGNDGKWMSSLIRSTRIVTLAPSNRRVPGQVLDGRPAVCMHLQGEGKGREAPSSPAGRSMDWITVLQVRNGK